MKKEIDDKKYSRRAEQIGNNIIKKSKLAGKYTSNGLIYLENFVKALLSVRPKQVHIRTKEKKGE